MCSTQAGSSTAGVYSVRAGPVSVWRGAAASFKNRSRREMGRFPGDSAASRARVAR